MSKAQASKRDRVKAPSQKTRKKKCPSAKIRYGTAVEAGVDVLRLAHQHRATKPYLCPLCGGWHLTHAVKDRT